jgi:DNA-binding transcriptional LysR family regulator
MEMRQLRHFIAVAEEKNFSLAARRVCLSQPALTRSIKNLESDLRTQLFERSSQGAVLTAAGAKFLDHARMILSDCDRAADEIRSFREGIAGPVTIGMGALFGPWLGDEIVERTREDLPGVDVTVIDGFFEELLGMLRGGRIDFALINFPHTEVAEDVVMEPLLELQARTLAAASHPLARARRVTPADLAAANWVVGNQAHSVESLREFFSSHDLPSPRAVRTNSLALITSLVLHRGYVTLISDSVLHREIQRGLVKALNVDVPAIRRKAGLLYLKRRIGSRAADRVVQIVRDVCRGRDR